MVPRPVRRSWSEVGWEWSRYAGLRGDTRQTAEVAFVVVRAGLV